MTEKIKLIENCPKCKGKFIKRKGADCSLTCETRKLEEEHEKIALEMISCCLSKIKVVIKFPKHLLAKWVFSKVKGWGWTDDIKGIITIPWWTLRSEEEFFDTVSHEAGHIKAYRKKFNSFERKVLETYVYLWESYKSSKVNSFFVFEKLEIHHDKYKMIMEKYRKWDGHDYDYWHKQYSRLFKKLIKFSFSKYTYGQTKPRKYGFDKHGKGRYKPKLSKSKE